MYGNDYFFCRLGTSFPKDTDVAVGSMSVLTGRAEKWAFDEFECDIK